MGQLQQTMQALPRLWLELLAVAGLAALVLTMLAQGRDVAGIAPTLGLFAAAAFKMTPGVNRALSSLQALIYGLPVINTLYEEFKLDVPDARPEDSAAPIVLQTAIRLDDVSYTYPTAQTPALDSLSIIVRKGESIGVIGASGSGKSTLVDVVLGLLAPTAGRVTVNGQEIHHHLRSWQTGIGYVPQSVYLIDDTLRANIAFGLRDEQIDDTVVTRVVAAAQLEEFVADLPDGLNAMVGERGIRLSGGQRQRIGIARALYWDPDVLVLDEATSALDTDTERDVMQSILALRGKKTIMIVAHRFSTLEGCDRLYRLSGGRVAEEDGPSAVLQSRPAAPNTQV
jgi:ABC-type multidrug transport system fused ATPase/permease subunit